MDIERVLKAALRAGIEALEEDDEEVFEDDEEEDDADVWVMLDGMESRLTSFGEALDVIRESIRDAENRYQSLSRVVGSPTAQIDSFSIWGRVRQLENAEPGRRKVMDEVVKLRDEGSENYQRAAREAKDAASNNEAMRNDLAQIGLAVGKLQEQHEAIEKRLQEVANVTLKVVG